jgi:iron-sulfur cluster repair protein YtfE (RIC family)
MYEQAIEPDPMSLTPLKRHPALVPLSHDHHHGLVVAQRLKRGDTAYQSVATIRESLELLWSEELEQHFRQEEEVLFVVPEFPEQVQMMIDRALKDHARMRELIEGCTDDDAGETGREVGLLLESHIRFEERELFPMIQEVLGEQRLRELEGRMVANAKCVR